MIRRCLHALLALIADDFKSSKYASPTNAPYDVITTAAVVGPHQRLDDRLHLRLGQRSGRRVADRG